MLPQSPDTPNKTAAFVDPAIQILTVRADDRQSWSYDLLIAPYWRLYWNTSPGAYIIHKGNRMELTPDSCFLIPPMIDYQARMDSPTIHCHIHFSTRLRLLDDYLRIYQIPATRPVQESFQRIAQTSHAREDEFDGLALSLEALHLVYAHLKTLPSSSFARHIDNPKIEATLASMQRSLASPLPNKVLAAEVGMNANAFIRLFKNCVGSSPQSHYTSLRMDLACELLHRNEISIDEVAERCGYKNRYHFSSAFKGRFARGPATYRRIQLMRTQHISRKEHLPPTT